jgi:hypothetical protein
MDKRRKERSIIPNNSQMTKGKKTEKCGTEKYEIPSLNLYFSVPHFSVFLIPFAKSKAPWKNYKAPLPLANQDLAFGAFFSISPPDCCQAFVPPSSVAPFLNPAFSRSADDRYFFCNSASAASTSSLCLATLTAGKTFAILPCRSMMKVLRAESLLPLYSITEP